MSNKKAQMTVFIIIGIVVLAGSAALFYFLSPDLDAEVEEAIRIPKELAPIKEHIDTCLQAESIPGIYLAAMQGGYITPPPEHLVTDDLDIAYWFNIWIKKTPGLAKVEEEISGYIEGALESCVNFSEYEARGMTITTEEADVITKINNDNVVIKVYYPVHVNMSNKILRMSKFIYTVPVRLGHTLKIAEKIVDKIEENPEQIGIDFLSEFDADIMVLPYDENIIIYIIKDPKSIVEGVEFAFSFAARFRANSAPELEPIRNFVLTKGTEFIYKVNAADPDFDELNFADNTPLFDIDTDTGFILFTPQETGFFEATITVTDSFGEFDSEDITILIEDEIE